MNIRKGFAVVAMLPALAFGLAACSDKADSKTEGAQSAQSAQSSQSGEPGVAMSGFETAEVLESVGVFTLSEDAIGYAEPDESSESIGRLLSGDFPLLEIDGDWKAIEVINAEGDTIAVWTNGPGETSLDVIVDDVEIEEVE